MTATVERRKRGAYEYASFTGASPDAALADLRARSPQMFETLLDAFRGPLAHAELGRAQRELASLAILAAGGGAEAQLAVHARAALHQGWVPSELRALAEHVAVYAGFPRGLNALAVIDGPRRVGDPAPRAGTYAPPGRPRDAGRMPR
jgi:3-oxoadipate enol-lactonase